MSVAFETVTIRVDAIAQDVFGAWMHVRIFVVAVIAATGDGQSAIFVSVADELAVFRAGVTIFALFAIIGVDSTVSTE